MLSWSYRYMIPDADEDRWTAMHEALVEESSEPLFALDSSGAIDIVNEAFAGLSGYDREELTGRTLSSLVHEDDRGEWERRLQILRNDETTESESWTSRLRTKNQTAVEVEWECSVLSAGETAVVGSATDIRGGQQKEQKLRILNRALRHNIRNQMNVVIARAESLQNIDDEGYRTAAEKIAESGENIINLSNKARKAQQHLDIPPDAECIQELVQETETVCQKFAITYPSATVETDLPDRAPAVAPPSYNVALTELIENGVVYHPSGNGPVTVRITCDEDEVVVAVEDECGPIPEQVLATMNRGTEQPLEHNDGLGLWLVRWIVEPVGGTLSFDRRDDDSGNVVSLTFDRPQP
jgi:PAS domain S-box-containing protein